LFWAIKGGGGGSLGVLTRLTLGTWELPRTIGGVFGQIKATSGRAYRDLVSRLVQFYVEKLFNPHWGEQITSEADFFDPNWKQSYWGPNYPRLAEIKKRYDPEGLFFTHHGLGSDAWGDDGSTRISVQ
jgi:Berberine and berberine like